MEFAKPGDTYIKQKVYYSNCRLNGKTVLLAGPFLSATDAEETLDTVGPVVVNENPDLRRASFGVMQCNAPGAGNGQYNHILPPKLAMKISIGVRLN